MKNTSDRKEKIIKLIFKALFCAIAAYMLYIMISHYTAPKEAQVSLSFTSDETNIIESVCATYIMKENEGQLMLETNEKTNALSYDDMIGKAFEIKSLGNSVSSATLKINYDDKSIDFDEESIKLMRINENGDIVSYKSSIDTQSNTISAEFFGGGIWYLAR